MRHSKLIYLALVFLSTLNVSGQQQPQGQPITGDIFVVYYLQYNGTPFYSSQSVQGGVQLMSGTAYSDLQIQYDLYRDQIIYFNKALSRMVVMDKPTVKRFWFTDNTTQKVYNVINLTDTNQIVNGFIFELMNDSVSLYMKKKKELDQNLNNYSVDLKMGKFYDKTHYYFDAGNGMVAMPTSRRKLASLFPEFKGELQSIMFRKGYSLKNESQVVAVFNEINRLKKQNSKP